MAEIEALKEAGEGEGLGRVRDITVVIPSFRTLDITRKCVESLRARYPEVPLIIFDDCSLDKSAEYIRELGDADSNMLAIISEINVGEGIAFNFLIRHAETRYVFTMHTDCVVLKGGFLGRMLKRFHAEPKLFAVGWLRPTHPRGPYRYVAPSAMLLDREKYLQLPPFINHGAPAIGTMMGAYKKGYAVEGFPISDYIQHERSRGSTGEELKRQINAGEISIEEIDRVWRPQLINWKPIKWEIKALREREQGKGRK